MPQETSEINLKESKSKVFKHVNTETACRHQPPPSARHTLTHLHAIFMWIIWRNVTASRQVRQSQGDNESICVFIITAYVKKQQKDAACAAADQLIFFTAGWSPSPDCIIIIPIILITLSPANSKPFKWWFLQLHIPHLNCISKYEHTWW